MFFQYLNLQYVATAREMLVRKSRLMSTSTRIFSGRGGNQWSDGIQYWLLSSLTTLTLALRLLYLMTTSCTTPVTQKLSLRTYAFFSIALLILSCFLPRLCGGQVQMRGILPPQIYGCYTFPLAIGSYKMLPYFSTISAAQKEWYQR